MGETEGGEDIKVYMTILEIIMSFPVVWPADQITFGDTDSTKEMILMPHNAEELDEN